MTDPFGPFKRRFKVMSEKVNAFPDLREGTVASSSPLKVFLGVDLDGTRVATPARSLVGALPVGSRVFCVEQDSRVVVIAGGDTDWVDVLVQAGFAEQNQAERPQVRRQGNRVWWRGGFSDAGFTANAAHDPGIIPAGFRPQVSAALTPILSSPHPTTARVTPNGTVNVRTGATLSGYYLFGGSWLTD